MKLMTSLKINISLQILAIVLLFIVALLTGCANNYNPNNAQPTSRDIASMTPSNLVCPVGSVMFCNVEGGGLVGKTYNNCRCRN